MAAQSSNQRVINPCEITPDIFTFDSGPFNFYLIRENGRITLVDAAFPGYYGVFRDGLAAIGHSLTDLEAIILTHAHADHIGFSERVRKETKVPVFVHKEDRVLASRPLQLPWPLVWPAFQRLAALRGDASRRGDAERGVCHVTHYQTTTVFR